MISLMGKTLLFCALLCATTQCILPFIGYVSRNIYFSATARPLLYAQSIFVILAYGLLTFAFYENDFSLTYVLLNSHPQLPVLYRLAAVWGAHEGSILLWIFVLNLWCISFTIFHHEKSHLDLTLSILGLLSSAFLAFITFTSNPFLENLSSINPKDLNPLLQDPGFISHPPMLYAGYVGFSITFAIALSALITHEIDQKWIIVTRQYAIAAWSFLTLGICLGSWWAYRVLGWGGIWFWDPVENASLLPWLCGTALFHCLLLANKKQTAQAWCTILAMFTFILSILGTFLVRSGVLVSVHSFANDPSRGIFLLLILAIVSITAMLVYLFKIQKYSKSSIAIQFFSRESLLLLNSGLFFTAMITVLIGTLYPLCIDALQLGSISVGAPYFNKVLLPFVLICLVAMGFVPFCTWQSNVLPIFFNKTLKTFFISILAGFVCFFIFDFDFNWIAAGFLSLCFWVLFGIKKRQFFTPMSLGHTGFIVLMVGIIFSSFFSLEREVKIQPGEQIALGPYHFLFISLETFKGPNYLAIKTNFNVSKGNHHVTNLYPEKRLYTVRQMVMSKVDIHPGIFRDLYIALGEPLENNYWTVRIYYKPFVRWIWMGGLIMMLGGALAVFKLRNKSIKEAIA